MGLGKIDACRAYQSFVQVFNNFGPTRSRRCCTCSYAGNGCLGFFKFAKGSISHGNNDFRLRNFGAIGRCLCQHMIGVLGGFRGMN